MNRPMRYWALGALCGLVLLALSSTGCSSNKYEPITLPEKTEEQGKETNQVSSFNEAISLADGAEDEKAADGEAVAGTSPLNHDLTTASGFSDRDEVVYVKENLINLRSGCGTEYTIITQLNTGESLKRTGYSEGWSRVLYKDKTCYVLSEYVDTTNPNEENVVAQGGAEPESEGLSAGMTRAASNGRIVAIDAGHQVKGNSEKEPIGPGSTTMKPKVPAGAEGILTKTPEYKLTLEVAKRVKRVLEERGYTVVMIRETNDVNISDAERAEMANKSGASAFVRIHANSLENSSVNGILSMCQTPGNPYNGELHAQSYSLSKRITDQISGQTGFKNRGVQETDTMSGINWCKIPVSIVEMGFLSNPEEDQKMAQEEYQEKIAAGIADGVDAYFGG